MLEETQNELGIRRAGGGSEEMLSHRNWPWENWQRARDGAPLKKLEPLDWGPVMERITKAKPTKSLRVMLSFSDGLTGEVDLEPLMQGPVFESLKADQRQFRGLRVDRHLGTIVWPNDADLDPDVLYALASGKSLEEALAGGSTAQR